MENGMRGWPLYELGVAGRQCLESPDKVERNQYKPSNLWSQIGAIFWHTVQIWVGRFGRRAWGHVLTSCFSIAGIVVTVVGMEERPRGGCRVQPAHGQAAL